MFGDNKYDKNKYTIENDGSGMHPIAAALVAAAIMTFILMIAAVAAPMVRDFNSSVECSSKE